VLRKDGNGEKGDDHLVSSYNSYNRKRPLLIQAYKCWLQCLSLDDDGASHFTRRL
jgi:hypothetical protein